MSEQPTRDAARAQRALWVALGVIVTAYCAHVWGYLFLNDDAFISFRYADHWSRAGEVVYNLGERVEGYTNFLWVALLAAVAKLGGDIPTWGLWLGPALGLMSFGSAVWLTSRISAPSPLADHLAPLSCAGLLALSPSFACWSSGGLEVQLFTLLLTLTLAISLLGWSQRSARLSGLAGGLGALMTMTRPEGLMFVGLLGLWRLKRLLSVRHAPRAEELTWLAVYLCLYLPYWLWRWQYYGHPLPNTYYVKTGAEGLWAPGCRYLLSCLQAEPWLLCLSLPLLSALLTRSSPPQDTGRAEAHNGLDGLWVMSLLWAGGLSLHVARVGGDFMANHRFLVPIMPICAALSASALSQCMESLRAVKWAPRLLPLLLLCSLALGQGLNAQRHHEQVLKVGSERGVDSIGWLNQFVRQCEQIGRWIDENTPAETRIATTAAGAIAYYSRRPTLDLLGLNDEWVAHNAPARGARPGHTKSAPLSYVLKWGVDLLIYHPVMSERPPRAHAGFQRALEPRGYQWRVFQPPQLSPPYWGVWLKRGALIPSSPSSTPNQGARHE